MTDWKKHHRFLMAEGFPGNRFKILSNTSNTSQYKRLERVEGIN